MFLLSILNIKLMYLHFWTSMVCQKAVETVQNTDNQVIIQLSNQ